MIQILYFENFYLQNLYITIKSNKNYLFQKYQA